MMNIFNFMSQKPKETKTMSDLKTLQTYVNGTHFNFLEKLLAKFREQAAMIASLNAQAAGDATTIKSLQEEIAKRDAMIADVLGLGGASMGGNT
jgi:hypothetical protein